MIKNCKDIMESGPVNYLGLHETRQNQVPAGVYTKREHFAWEKTFIKITPKYWTGL